MPGSGHIRRGICLVLLGICGTVFFVWAVDQLLSQPQGPNAGIWVSIGLVASFMPLVAAGINFWQGSQANKMYRDETSLARWTLSHAERQAYVKATHDANKPSLGVLLGISAFLVVIAFVLKQTAFQNAGWGVFMLCLLTIMAIMLYVAFVIPWLQKRRMQSDSPDVVIGLHGAVLPGQYVRWNRRQLGMIAARLGAVSLVREGGRDVLTVVYHTLSRAGYMEQRCRIPVPNGKRAEATQAGRKIAEASGVDFCNETKAPL